MLSHNPAAQLIWGLMLPCFIIVVWEVIVLVIEPLLESLFLYLLPLLSSVAILELFPLYCLPSLLCSVALLMLSFYC